MLTIDQLDGPLIRLTKAQQRDYAGPAEKEKESRDRLREGWEGGEALGFFDEFDEDVWPILSDEQVQEVIERSNELHETALKERDRRKSL